MAEREVAVRLTANTAQYQAGMRQAERATEQMAGGARTNFSQVGQQLSNVGGTLTRSVTLPIVGAGAAAVKLSSDFNSAFGQMVGLAGVPAGEVDRLKESVLELAGETAQAPQELAEALYFAASAGLDSAQAMEAVGLAARASAAGMGSAQDVVGLVASAMASYGAANISAAEATDILTATIREGRAEPAELAGALGRILPVAASLGVEFEEVGGTVAYLSNIFGDTDRTVTAVNDTFAKLAAPADSARVALDAAGTSADELKRTISEDGLLAGLELLRTHGFAGNAEAIRELMPDMQGAAALTALLADESGTLAQVLGQVADSQGAAGVAFEAIDENSQALKQSWVDLQIALIQVGEVLGPIIADLASDMAGLVSAFSDLPEPLQKIVLGVAAFVAAGGPLLLITGSMIRNFRDMRSALTGAGGLSVALGAVSLALVGAAAIYMDYNNRKQEAIARTETWIDLLKQEASGVEDAGDSYLVSKYATEEYADVLEDLGITAADVARYIRGESVPALEALEGATVLTSGEAALLMRSLQQQKDAIEAGQATIDREIAANRELGETYRDNARHSSEFTDAERERAEAAADGTEKDNSHVEALRGLAELLPRVTVENRSKAAADERAAEAADRHREAVEAVEEAMDRQLSAALRLIGGDIGVRESKRQATEAINELNTSIADGTLKYEDLGPAVDAATLSTLGAAQAAAEYKAQQMEANGIVVDAETKNRLMKEEMLRLAGEIDGPVKDAILRYIAYLDSIPDAIDTQVSVHFAGGGGGIGVNIGGDIVGVRTGTRAGGGPVLAGGVYEVNERGHPELLSMNGHQYLMSPAYGYVTPMTALSTSSGTSSTVTNQGARYGQYVETQVVQNGADLDQTVRGWNTLLAIGG